MDQFTLANPGFATYAIAASLANEVRATFYSIGSIIVIAMAIWVLVAAVQAA